MGYLPDNLFHPNFHNIEYKKIFISEFLLNILLNYFLMFQKLIGLFWAFIITENEGIENVGKHAKFILMLWRLFLHKNQLPAYWHLSCAFKNSEYKL